MHQWKVKDKKEKQLKKRDEERSIDGQMRRENNRVVEKDR